MPPSSDSPARRFSPSRRRSPSAPRRACGSAPTRPAAARRSTGRSRWPAGSSPARSIRSGRSLPRPRPAPDGAAGAAGADAAAGGRDVQVFRYSPFLACRRVVEEIDGVAHRLPVRFADQRARACRRRTGCWPGSRRWLRPVGGLFIDGQLGDESQDQRAVLFGGGADGNRHGSATEKIERAAHGRAEWQTDDDRDAGVSASSALFSADNACYAF